VTENSGIFKSTRDGRPVLLLSTLTMTDSTTYTYAAPAGRTALQTFSTSATAMALSLKKGKSTASIALIALQWAPFSSTTTMTAI
jgi:hypothetical protein